MEAKEAMQLDRSGAAHSSLPHAPGVPALGSALDEIEPSLAMHGLDYTCSAGGSRPQLDRVGRALLHHVRLNLLRLVKVQAQQGPAGRQRRGGAAGGSGGRGQSLPEMGDCLQLDSLQQSAEGLKSGGAQDRAVLQRSTGQHNATQHGGAAEGRAAQLAGAGRARGGASRARHVALA